MTISKPAVLAYAVLPMILIGGGVHFWKKQEIKALNEKIQNLIYQEDLLNEQLNFATNDTRIMIYHCKASGGTLNGVICECPTQLIYDPNSGECREAQ